MFGEVIALIAAILAPTDAALGQAVVSNEDVPLLERQTLTAESGLNDDLALPVILLFSCMVASMAVTNQDKIDWLIFAGMQVTGVHFCAGKLTGQYRFLHYLGRPLITPTKK